MVSKKRVRSVMAVLILVVVGSVVYRQLNSHEADLSSTTQEGQNPETSQAIAPAAAPSSGAVAPESKDAKAPDPHAGEPLTAEERTVTVKTKDLKVGNSKIVVQGSQVSFHTVMQLMDGKVVFDSRKDGRPWTGVIGDGSLILGLDLGLRGMFQGGKRALWIPPHMAYGRFGVNPQVPPNSKIYAEVEMLSVF